MSNCINTTDQQYFFELSFAEQLMLWSIRTWACGYQLQTSVDERLFDAFSRVRIPRAAGLLDKIMRTVIIGHSRAVAIHCPCHRLVGDDERILLDVIARYQTGHLGKTWFPLCRFLRPDAAQGVGKLLDEMAGMLTAAGLTLTNPWMSREQPHPLASMTALGAFSTQLH